MPPRGRIGVGLDVYAYVVAHVFASLQLLQILIGRRQAHLYFLLRITLVRHDVYVKGEVGLADLQERQRHQHQQRHAEGVRLAVHLERETHHDGLRAVAGGVERRALNELKRSLSGLSLRLNAVG